MKKKIYADVEKCKKIPITVHVIKEIPEKPKKKIKVYVEEIPQKRETIKVFVKTINKKPRKIRVKIKEVK
jgi:phenylpyruvate tautomerase PptA (4-oxalocrotonate tautomerase family)